MAATPKKLVRVTPTTANSYVTGYTVPANTTAIIKNIVVSNAATSEATVSILADEIPLMSDFPVASKDTIVVDLSSVLETGKTIKYKVSAANAVGIHISGVEVV